MFKKTLYVSVAGLFLLSQISCASIVSGSKQKLPVVTNPEGATITISSDTQTSPATFVLDREEPYYVVNIEKEGYKTVSLTLKRDMNGWVWGNVLLGGIIGLIVDFSTGAAYKFNPDEVTIDLIAQGMDQSKMQGKDVLYVKLIESGK